MSARRTSNAYSLLEVVLASAICATALVPALAFLRDGMTLADIDRHAAPAADLRRQQDGGATGDRRRDLGRREPLPATSPPTAMPISVSRSRGPTRRPAAELTID